MIPGCLFGEPFMHWAILTLALLGADGIEPAEFQKLHQELQAPADEPWRSIPWKISLLDARKEAAQRQRPIFIWAMDGHPLGCT